MRGSVRIVCGLFVAALVMAQVAEALSPASVSSVVGTAIRMRGNSVKLLSRGDSVIDGDRVITSNGARVTFANGASLGPNSSVVIGKSSSGSSSSSKSDSKSLSKLFDDDKDGKDRRDDDKKDDKKKGNGDRDDDHDKDHDKDHDHDGHDNDHDDDDCPWEGNPKDPSGVSD